MIRDILKNNKSECDSLNFEGKNMSGERRGVIFLDLFNVSDYLEQFCCCCCCCCHSYHSYLPNNRPNSDIVFACFSVLQAQNC